MIDTTVAIATIGRFTLRHAIESAIAEDLRVVVVADGVDLEQSLLNRFSQKRVKFYKTGKKFGFYGSMPHNLAAYVAETEFVSQLGDDDEIFPGKGQVIREKINSEPDIDIWIPGLLFNNKPDGSPPHAALMNEGLWDGNVGSPTLKTNVLACCPMRHPRPHEWAKIDAGLDFWHIREAVNMGFKIKWMNELIVSVRPRLLGMRGFGKTSRALKIL